MKDGKSKAEIEKMGINEVEKLLLERYNVAKARIEKYPDDIKRGLLFDLETHVGKRQ
jgi:hypothetical protein